MNKTYNEKLKSFEQYHAMKQTEKLVQKAYTDHLLQQLAEATQPQPTNQNEVIQSLNELKEMVKPSTDFFTTPTSAHPVNPVKKTRISKKAREQQELEDHLKMLERKALLKIKNEG
ncbi:hypothetical protein [Pedobacter sp. MR2016-24]|uniref:hypothetical protein n=1 Tax=Pedobacter sp. MR2016-24 TaxID=2994466 RepID=UPI0022474F80|nr:hypothetical protein [Pedobacter sp. MR2016-24]MCX2486581.1 hypothetical protein [Pedobacter sp. MR2016-24]